MDTESTILRRAGIRVTYARRAVLAALRACAEAGEMLTAVKLLQRVQRRGNTVSLAAIYRTLSHFEQFRLVARHHFSDGPAVHQLTTRPHRNHFVCEQSGDIVEFDSTELEQLGNAVAAASGFEIIHSERVLYVRKTARP